MASGMMIAVRRASFRMINLWPQPVISCVVTLFVVVRST